MGFKDRFRPLALLTVLVLILAACGGDSATTTTAADGGATTTAADVATTTAGGGGEEQIELLVWASRPYYVPPDQFASFTAEYPNVTVTFDIQSNDDMLQQLLLRRDAGQALPDVLGAEDSFLIETFVEAGLLLPHNDIAAQWEAEDPDLYNLLLPLAWDETTLDGEKYGLSVTANFDVLYYNTAWFAEAGVEPPFESLDDVLDAMRAMKAARPDSIPFTVQAQAGQGVTTLKTLLAAAGAPFNGAVPDLNSPGGIYAINWFLQAAAEGLLPPEAIAWGEDESRGAFVSSNAGLILDGFTTAGDFNAATGFAYPDQWNITPVPLSQSGGGADGVALSSARAWAVIAGTEHPEEAALILRYIAETDNLVEAVFEGSVPMRQTEAINDPRLQEFWPFFNEDLKQAYLNSTPAPAGPNAGEVEGILEQMFGEIVVGTDKTAEELAAEFQPLLDAA
ncbi:MAG TPA: extracellular solute-binding protein [Acidimicrobiia bacterium]|nr:extracellular solute-binding protein [Acidimicrobiia bacterium]